MDQEQQHYQNLQQNRTEEVFNNSGGFANAENAQASASGDPQQKYDQLQQNRIEDARRSANQTIAGATSADVAKGADPEQKKLSLKNLSAKDLGSAALAFTAIDLSKDASHFLIILFSVIADLFTIIPFFGNLFSFLFSILIWILYAVSGHLKHRVGRKAVIIASSQALEAFALGLGILPFFTMSALLNYWLALTERKKAQE